MAQQSYLNTTSKTAPDKQEMIRLLHGPTVIVPDAPAGGKAPGDDCGSPILIPLSVAGDLPYILNTQTTTGHGFNYSNTCLNDFDGGEDIIYKLELDFDTTLFFQVEPNGTTYTGFALNEQCFDNPTTTCLAVSTDTYGDGLAHGFAIALEAGTYYIMVDMWNTSKATSIPDFDLTISATTPIPNDDCANAMEVGLLNQYYYSTVEANDGDVWFKYTAGFTGTLAVDVCDSDFDTYLELRDNCAGSLLAIGNNECGFNGLQSSLSYGVTSGTTYFITVGGKNSKTGTGYLNLFELPAPCTLSCPASGTPENETCDTDINGECATAMAVSTGDTICGNLWADNNYRDTDWLKVTLTSISSVKLAVIGEKAVIFGMVSQNEAGNAACDNLGNTFSEYKITPGCVEDSIEFMNLPVGTYYFVVAPAAYSGSPCPGPGAYGYAYQAAFTVEANATGTISGIVDDGTTGILGVTVSADIFSTTTAANGIYTLAVPVGVYDVTANGFEVAYSTEIVADTAVTDGGTTTVDFTLSDGKPTLTVGAAADFSWAKLNWTPVNPGPKNFKGVRRPCEKYCKTEKNKNGSQPR